jgi:hypothetical protein
VSAVDREWRDISLVCVALALGLVGAFVLTGGGS